MNTFWAMNARCDGRFIAEVSSTLLYLWSVVEWRWFVFDGRRLEFIPIIIRICCI